jgi:alkylation response protein AidB-like acyl-CoA dehydrogenase
MDALCTQLRALSPGIDAANAWPAESLDLLAEAGVYRWFVPQSHGGLAWSEADITRGYVRLASACLSTAFVLTQRSAACRRIASSTNAGLRDRLLPDLASGRIFATVGISHLSTSRRHLERPAMRARRKGSGYVLDGTSWWVSGAAQADHILVGAEIDGQHLLALVPGSAVRVGPRIELVALTSACTAAMHLDGVEVSPDDVVSGPAPPGIGMSRTGGTAGIQSSSLAVGLARAAADLVATEAVKRTYLVDPHRALTAEIDALESDLVAYAEGDDTHGKIDLRLRANALALGATQEALRVAKGAGYVAGRDPGRWCREALFFLVWSLPAG